MELPTASSLLSCSPSPAAQICLLVLHAVLWWSFINWASKTVVAPFVKMKAWKEQWLRLNKAFFKNSLFTVFDTDDDAFDFACLFQAILAQHLVGGILCLPSCLGFTGKAFSAMACHGALCEAGWELQDIISRLHQRSFQGVQGRKMNPLPLLAVVAVHHAMGQAMVVPMNLLYHDSPDYHEFVFLLQAAAFVAMMLQSYGYTLNVQTNEGLLQMRVSITISWMTILYSRVVRFTILGYRLAHRFYSDGNWIMLYVGSSALVLMALFNLMIFADATQKLLKFTAAPQPMVTCEAPCPACGAVQGAVLLGSSGKRKWQ